MSLRVTPFETVGRYRLLGELGQGGTATVSLAVASGPAGFNKLVVLKKMKPQFISEPGFAEMFLTEARLAARLNHPNIVQTNEVFEHEGLPVLVMEYLEGKSFADIGAARSAGGPFQLRHCLTVISEALSGLHYSHEVTDYNGRSLELVHRDMTPHNVFVSYEGQVKILDFGIAKLKDSNVNTETGVVKGKLRYIPPEQIVGEAVDRRADVYSVGVMLWEIAAGEKLWRGMSDAAVMNRVINEKIPRPSEKNSNVDPALEAVIMRALSAAPEARHPTALHLQREIDDVRRGLSSENTTRELMPALDAMFGADRTKTRKLVEMRLGQLALGTEDSGFTTTSPTLKAYAALKPAHLSGPPRAERMLGPWLLALAVLAAVTVYLAVRETDSSGDTLGRVQSVAAVPAAAEVVLPSHVVNGNAGEAPAVGSGPVGARELHGGAPSQSSPTQHVRSEPVTAPAPQARSQRRAPQTLPSSKVLATSAEPPVAAANPCSPPFAVDARGVKRFKPQCVR
jgi:eukaryotic-like serine/threonine-protein kinase